MPHIATALWAELRPGTRLHRPALARGRASALVQDTVQLVVQVNGKLRGHLDVPAAASREEIEAIALADARRCRSS